MNVFQELYHYREFFKTSVKKEFRGKYKKSFLGVLWSFINPLMQILVYSFVFSFITRVQTDNYTMFLVVALIPWTFFSNSLIQSSIAIVANEGIIKKIYFPRIVLPISIVTSNLINFLISFIIIIGALIISGIGFSSYIVFLPLVILTQYLLLIGLCIIISAITVYVRDIQHFISIVMMMWMYLTPVIYPTSLIPSRFLWIFKLNPMYSITEAYRDILYNQQLPDVPGLIFSLLFALGVVILGYFVFKKCEKRFAEEL